MERDELDDDRPMSVRCAQCGECPEWESLSDGYGERWLGVCRCGRMQAFLPDQPAVESKDALAAFLLGAGREISAPTPAIGRLLGGRDHTTVMHGAHKISAELRRDAQLRGDLQAVRELLQAN